MEKFRDVVWPHLEAPEPACVQANDNTIFDNIEKADWDCIDPVLEEARALALREDERRKSAETKATIYLAVLAAIVPVTATLVKEFYGVSQSFGGWLFAIIMMLFLLGMSYLLAAGIWAFRTIQVSAYHRLDVAELLKLSDKENVKIELCKEILKCVKKNQDPVNKKTTRLIMAHEFLVRWFVLYVFLIIVVGTSSVWPSLNRIVQAITQCV